MVRSLNEDSTREGSTRVRRRADTRRLEILRAASKVFRRRGYFETSMREIAAEADLSPGNLYHYFAGKDEILYFCQDRTLDKMLAALSEVGADGGSVSQQVTSIIVGHVRFMLDDLEGGTAHLQVEALPQERQKPIIDKRDRYERAIRKLIAKGVRTGEFAKCDAKLVTRAILGAVNWSARWFSSEGSKSASEVAEGLADYLVRGLVAGEKGPKISPLAGEGL